jgi:hypothetical protein
MPEPAARRRLREEREKATAEREADGFGAVAHDVDGYPIQAMTGMRLAEIETIYVDDHDVIGELVTEVRRLLVVEAAFAETMNPTVPYSLNHVFVWACRHGFRRISLSTVAAKIAEKRDALAELHEACCEIDRRGWEIVEMYARLAMREDQDEPGCAPERSNAHA